MRFSSAFRCIAGCAGSHSLDIPIYRCPNCQGLLEVAHDLEALKKRNGDTWRALFHSRHRQHNFPNNSAVWAKREWVAPHLEDADLVTMQEGGTPLIDMPKLAQRLGLGRLWVKQCGQSPTGSFKDLGMTVLVSTVKRMIRQGRAIAAVACASTGDTSASLAAYCARAEIPSLVLLPRGNVTTTQLVQPLAHGATVLSLDTDFDGCMAIVQRLADEGHIYLANSMNSLRLEGQKTVAIELAQQLNWESPEVVVIPGGNLGNVSALGAGFDMMQALGLITTTPRIVVAQAERANPLYRAFKHGWNFSPVQAEPTLASAIQIGNPVSINKAIATLKKHRGLVEQASESELAEAAAAADRCGLYTCPQTAVALAVLRKIKAQGHLAANARAVVISTASGLKFTDFKIGYHEDRLPGLSSEMANRPLELANNYDAVRRVVDEVLAARNSESRRISI